MRFCHLTRMYIDENHSVPLEAVYEADLKLKNYNMTNQLGSFLYGIHLIDELKEKYKCQDSSGSRAVP